MKKYSCILLGFVLSLSSLSSLSQTNDNWKKLAQNPDFLHRSIKIVTDVIVHDIYSPPVASRIYAFVTIAGYEAALDQDDNYLSLAGQLNGLRKLPLPDTIEQCSYPLASVHALMIVAETMIISEERIAASHVAILEQFKETGMPAAIFENSLSYGKKVADHIIDWASKDNYKQTRSLPKYAVLNDAATWQPTPPSYMKAVEPHWDGIRTFIIDSPRQFSPAAATAFSTEKNSPFFKEASAVFDAGLKLSREQIEIANFWDCNPFKMNINGHVMFATKKISPGGHWINITGLACRKANKTFEQSAEAYACLSIILADAFISCWAEKYRSKVIRPETYINQYISGSWTPLLQTPPFPEYTSGHSVISAASAIILTKLFGDAFSYDDSTEVDFNIPVRHFNSFKQAAEEAAISRFYGGIHYMPSIVNGVSEGEKLGTFISQKLRTRKEESHLSQ
ncbi:MAG: vanadium-dependent haloperoxidase [Ferruginibacter sp.]